ncbi:MAG: type IV secretion system protein VirB8 [Rickettsiales bacterium]|jgi:type IV secretion system protein VirB8
MSKPTKTTSNLNSVSSSTLNNKSGGKNGHKFKIKSWYSNRYEIVVVQRNILLLLALLLTIAMTTSILFVKFVVSSKSLEPYVIEVEEKSGVATIVNQLTTETLTADESIRNYFISQFIQAAVAYEPRTYKTDVEIVRLLSNQNVYTEFRNRINSRELGINSKIKIRIKSTKFFNSATAQVRILESFSSKEKGSYTKDKVINMSFVFTNLNLTAEERLINPLGFQVTRFLISEEIFDY